jgi:hypothetical protein
MSKERPLMIEVLSGPLDGATITLEADAAWSRAGKGPLIFPWDIELGQPQAHFTVEEDGWWLEGLNAPHGTYRLNGEERIREKVRLKSGDILKASSTWLLIQEA